MMSFLPYMVHYCADLLWSVKKGGAAQDWEGRQLLRSKASQQELCFILRQMHGAEG